MYLYVAFFDDMHLARKRYFLSGHYYEPVKTTFPKVMDLDSAAITDCIAYIKNKESGDKNCYAINIRNVHVDENFLSFDFDIMDELNTSNEKINKSLYRFARRLNWVDKETQFFPLLCLMDKRDFDTVRKGTPNARKISSNSAKIEKYRMSNKWQSICNLYEPLDKAHENSELWNNADDLYDLAFACSKLGEPRNGKERDSKHLEEVRRYRDLSILFFTRCTELQPGDFRYASAVAYRYYLSVMELTKPRGRRDGILVDEISNARKWFDKALELNPRSIKDHYRKGKLVIDAQIANFKYATGQKTREDYNKLDQMESDGIRHLKAAIEHFEHLDQDDLKNRYGKEYIRALYTLGCFFIEKPNMHWNEYACYRIKGLSPKIRFEDLQYIADGRDLLEKCFAVETDMSLDGELDISQLAKMQGKWAISPADKLYRLGQVYLKMYYVKTVLNKEDERINQYQTNAKKYLTTAKNIGYELRKQRRGKDDRFISERLARYYIIADQFNDAIRTIERIKRGYIINTYSIALLLSGSEANLARAEEALINAAGDKNNKAKNMSVALLAYIYNKKGEQSKLNQLALNENELFNGGSSRLLSILGVHEESYENRCT